MENFLGIDIGGTNVKVGVVNPEGDISDHKKYPTVEVKANGNFLENFLNIVSEYLNRYNDIKKVGIGVPGILDKSRSTPLEVPAISDLDNLPLKSALEKRFPKNVFFLENDVNAAAIGEYYYSKEDIPEDYIFITLGTGVGGAAIMGRQIFKGGDGNSMEIGHLVSRNNRQLERNIGKIGITNMAIETYIKFPEKTAFKSVEDISTSKLVQAASEGDKFSLAVFNEVGQILAEGLVAAIRILDIKNIFIGGGMSASFEYITPGMNLIFDQFLTPYYRDSLVVRRATLGNQAGIIGAAALCFIDIKNDILID
jgi:glucokinase